MAVRWLDTLRFLIFPIWHSVNKWKCLTVQGTIWPLVTSMWGSYGLVIYTLPQWKLQNRLPRAGDNLWLSGLFVCGFVGLRKLYVVFIVVECLFSTVSFDNVRVSYRLIYFLKLEIQCQMKQRSFKALVYLQV